MSPLHAWVLAASSTLAPGRSHDRLAEAITNRVEMEAPLFKGDEDKKRTASFLVAVAFRESSLKADAVGDFRNGKPTSFCAFQVHTWDGRTSEGWSGPDLAEDPNKCVTVAMRMLRQSMKMCPEHPLAFYAEGPKGCESPRGQRISRDRLAIAQHLVRKVPFDPNPAPMPRDDERSRTDAALGSVAASRTRRFCAP